MESITIDNGVEEVELQLTRTSIMMLFRTRNVPIKSFRSVAAQLGIENMEEAPAGAIGAAVAEHFNKEATAAAVAAALADQAKAAQEISATTIAEKIDAAVAVALAEKIAQDSAQKTADAAIAAKAERERLDAEAAAATEQEKIDAVEADAATEQEQIDEGVAQALAAHAAASKQAKVNAVVATALADQHLPRTPAPTTPTRNDAPTAHQSSPTGVDDVATFGSLIKDLVQQAMTPPPVEDKDARRRALMKERDVRAANKLGVYAPSAAFEKGKMADERKASKLLRLLSACQMEHHVDQPAVRRVLSLLVDSADFEYLTVEEMEVALAHLKPSSSESTIELPESLSQLPSVLTILRDLTAQDKALSAATLDKIDPDSNLYTLLSEAQAQGALTSLPDRLWKMMAVFRTIEGELPTKDKATAEASRMPGTTINFKAVVSLSMVFTQLEAHYEAVSAGLKRSGLGLPFECADWILECLQRGLVASRSSKFVTLSSAELTAMPTQFRNEGLAGDTLMARLKSVAVSVDKAFLKAYGQQPPPTEKLFLCSVSPTLLHANAVTDPFPDGMCTKCLVLGHAASACTGTVVCMHCGDTGHYRSACPAKDLPAKPPKFPRAGGAGR